MKHELYQYVPPNSKLTLPKENRKYFIKKS